LFHFDKRRTRKVYSSRELEIASWNIHYHRLTIPFSGVDASTTVLLNRRECSDDMLRHFTTVSALWTIVEQFQQAALIHHELIAVYCAAENHITTTPQCKLTIATIFAQSINNLT